MPSDAVPGDTNEVTRGGRGGAGAEGSGDDILSLDDFRPAFPLGGTAATASARATLPVDCLQRLIRGWDSCLAYSTSGLHPDHEWDVGGMLDLAFYLLDYRTPVKFRDLPIAVQAVIGGPGTILWYRIHEVPGTTAQVPSHVKALTASTWRRRVIPVRDLAEHVLTRWAMTYLYWGIESDQFSDERGFTYRDEIARAIRTGEPGEPVIFYNGEICSACVVYALTLLRFAPGAHVRVLEGEGLPASEDIEDVAPVTPSWAWANDGFLLCEETYYRSCGQWGEAFDGRTARAVLAGDVEPHIILTAMGGTREEKLAYLWKKATFAYVPYVTWYNAKAAAMPREARRAWRAQPPRAAPRALRVRLASLAERLSCGLFPFRRSRLESHPPEFWLQRLEARQPYWPAWRESRADWWERSELRRYLPELAVLPNPYVGLANPYDRELQRYRPDLAHVYDPYTVELQRYRPDLQALNDAYDVAMCSASQDLVIMTDPYDTERGANRYTFREWEREDT